MIFTFVNISSQRHKQAFIHHAYVLFCMTPDTNLSDICLFPFVRGNANLVSGHWQRAHVHITNTLLLYFTSCWPSQVLLRLWACIHSQYNSMKADLRSGFSMSILIWVWTYDNADLVTALLNKSPWGLCSWLWGWYVLREVKILSIQTTEMH